MLDAHYYFKKNVEVFSYYKVFKLAFISKRLNISFDK